jgi:glycosyltransferase involved in cell wall biosynthesis
VGLDLLADSPGLASAVSNNLRRVRALRAALRQARPQAVVSFTDKTNVLAILAAKGLGAPVIACEHIDPFRHDIGRLWSGLRRLTYPRAGAVVGVTGAAEQFVRRFVKHIPVLTIPNPQEPPPPPTGQPPPRPWPDGPTAMAMGRLNRQKGFDLLLQAFAMATAAVPGEPAGRPWQLVILGEGEERPALTALAAKLGLAGRVHMPGRVDSPYDLLRQAELFVMSSRYEGFPMGLLEAMACGLPVLCTDCSTGAREIITPGVDGELVPPEDVPALAAALAGLMNDPARRRSLAAHAPAVLERFSLQRVLESWDGLFHRLGCF